MSGLQDFDKSKICFISARLCGNDYWYDAVNLGGYTAVIPYMDYNLFFRILRELWFRLHLPKESIWYNHQIKKNKAQIYIVRDPLITTGFLTWLRKEKPDARIILDYDNRAENTIHPASIKDPSIEKWSYDPNDCRDYGMNLKPKGYFDCYRIQNKEKSFYDIVYVGRDKGRAEEILWIESELRKIGLHTCFRISPDRAFLLLKKKFYQPVISYREYLALIAKSRAILNIMPEGQKSITMRDYEAVFDGIKCITNNAAIKEFELYHPSRFFILQHDLSNIADITDFLRETFKEVDDSELENYKFDYMIYKMTEENLGKK